MAYTKRENIRYKKEFNASKMINDHVYERINYYPEDHLVHYILFELHLRLEEFEELYLKCYKYISDTFHELKYFPFNGYQELNKYAIQFDNFGYDLFEITKYIYQELCTIACISVNIPYYYKSEFVLENIFTENSTLYTPAQPNKLQINNDPFTCNYYNLDGSGYTKEYKSFLDNFNIYRFRRNVPINKHFIKNNSLNVNIFLSPADRENNNQIEQIHNLIKKISNTKNDELKTFVNLKRIDIITHLYIYDLTKKDIPNSKIIEYTKEYIKKQTDFIMYTQINKAKETMVILKNILRYINILINLLLNNEQIKTTHIINFVKLNQSLINDLNNIKLLTYNQLPLINDFVSNYQNFNQIIDEKYIQLQTSKAQEFIELNPEDEDYWTNNYNKINIDIVNFNFKDIFSSFNYNVEIKKLEKIEKNIDSLKKDYTKKFNSLKSKFNTIKSETLTKYSNTIETLVSKLQ